MSGGFCYPFVLENELFMKRLMHAIVVLALF